MFEATIKMRATAAAVALTIGAILPLTSGDAGATVAPAGTIMLRARSFTLAVHESTCMATLHDEANGVSSSPVPFLSLYNRVADARAVNLDPCVSVSVARLHTGRDVLRVQAAHGYGSVDIAWNSSGGSASGSPLVSHISFRLESIAAWHADPVERYNDFDIILDPYHQLLPPRTQPCNLLYLVTMVIGC